MVAIAILAVDPMLRGNLKQLPRDDPSITVAGIADSAPAFFELAANQPIDVVVTEAQLSAQLEDWRLEHEGTPLVAILTATERELDALGAAASAILPRTATPKDIVAAINAVARGFVVSERKHLYALLSAQSSSEDRLGRRQDDQARLTPRELEVLAAMADGLSNKAIARRLAISFHTAKFHVAAILEKLGADTRTEAVTKAAQRGIVML